MRSLGLRQKFIPIRFRHGRAIATREYFPRGVWRRGTAALALGHRESRCNRGNIIPLRETLRHFYWFWRDRKSLVGNIAGPLTNLILLYGVVTLAWANHRHRIWGLAESSASWLARTVRRRSRITGIAYLRSHVVLLANLWLAHSPALCPLRVIAGNWINCFATCRAIGNYTIAKLQGRPLRWVKTEHAYPNRAALLTDRKRLGEILTGGHGSLNPSWMMRSPLSRKEDD